MLWLREFDGFKDMLVFVDKGLLVQIKKNFLILIEYRESMKFKVDIGIDLFYLLFVDKCFI